MDTNNKPVAQTRTARAAHRLGKQARKVTKDLHDMGDIAKDVAHEKLDELRASASDHYEQGRDRVQQVERSFEQFVRDQPLKSILIATGVGLFLGRFWMRR